jgi:5-methylcytosine-specific restriction endonuclease McrA
MGRIGDDMSDDPLLAHLPISSDSNESISQLITMLGYEPETFTQILRSLLTEELLDRVRPSSEEIKELRTKPNHLELLREHLETATGVSWSFEAVQHYWERTRLLDKRRNRESIPFHRKLQVLATRPHCCHFCGRQPPEVKLHIDHIFAASKGGSNDLWNLRLLCGDCNLVKSNHLDWRLYVDR